MSEALVEDAVFKEALREMLGDSVKDCIREAVQEAVREAVQNRKEPTIAKRMLTEEEFRIYAGLGRSSVRQLGEKIGCIRHFGRRIMYDRVLIDEYFASQK